MRGLNQKKYNGYRSCTRAASWEGDNSRGIIYVSGLDSTCLKQFDAFVDCRGERWAYKNGPLEEYHKELNNGELYNWVQVNRACKAGIRHKPKFAHEFQDMFTGVVKGLGRRTNVHCMKGASRSHFIVGCLLVGGCPQGNMSPHDASRYLYGIRSIAEHSPYTDDHLGFLDAVEFYKRECQEICRHHGIVVQPLTIVTHEDLFATFHGHYRRAQARLNSGGIPPLNIDEDSQASAVASAAAQPTCDPKDSVSAVGSAEDQVEGARRHFAEAAEHKRREDAELASPASAVSVNSNEPTAKEVQTVVKAEGDEALYMKTRFRM